MSALSGPRLLLVGFCVCLALLAFPSAGAASVPPSATYGGSTSQRQAVSIDVSRDAKKLKRFLIQVNVTCDNNPQAAGQLVFEVAPVKVARSGRFAHDDGGPTCPKEAWTFPFA